MIYDGIDPTIPWYLGEVSLSDSGWELAAADGLAVTASH